MSKEAIIKKIEDDAAAKAAKITSEGEEKANSILDAARKECEQQLVAARAEIERTTEETLSRSRTVAELDAKRLLLDAKLKILDRVFARALEKLVALDKDAMRELLFGMLTYAENGDEVILNERGRALISAKDLKAYAQERGVSLKLSKEVGSFEGGLVLRQGGIDKNLTFASELAILRDSEEAEIAKQIFG